MCSGPGPAAGGAWKAPEVRDGLTSQGADIATSRAIVAVSS